MASITIRTNAAALVLPAASVAVTLIWAVPLAMALVGVTLQLPLLATVVFSTSPVPGTVTVIVSPVTPVPLRVGVVSDVRLSVLSLPVSLVAATSTEGIAAAVVSMSKPSNVAALVFPERSVVAYGNSSPDLPHLRLADKALLVNPGPGLRREAGDRAIQFVHWN